MNPKSDPFIGRSRSANASCAKTMYAMSNTLEWQTPALLLAGFVGNKTKTRIIMKGFHRVNFPLGFHFRFSEKHKQKVPHT